MSFFVLICLDRWDYVWFNNFLKTDYECKNKTCHLDWQQKKDLW